MIPKVASTFGFEIIATIGGLVAFIYEIDLTNGLGKTKMRKPATAYATFTMKDSMTLKRFAWINRT